MFFYNESDNEVSYQVPVVSDPYFYNTSLLLKMDSDFSDSSVHQHTATTGGNVSVNNSEFKYDGGSGYFDGNINTGVSFPSSDSFDLRGIDWTMEVWINPDGNYDEPRKIIAKRDYSGTNDYQIYIRHTTGKIAFYNGSTVIDSDVTPTTNQWTHVAAVRKDGVITIYVNGESKASQTLDIVSHNNVPLAIGNVGTLDRFPFRGYIDDVRITKGVARYTSNFTPPDSHPITGPSEIVSTDLQLHLDAGDTNSYPGTGTTWFDLSGNGNDTPIYFNPGYDNSSGGAFILNGADEHHMRTPQLNITNNFSYDFWFTPQISHEIDVQSTTGGAGGSGQKWLLVPDWRSPNAGTGLSVGTNGISVYEHGDNYLPATLVHQTSLSTSIPTNVCIRYTNKQPALFINGVFIKNGLTSPRPNVYMSRQIGSGTYGAFTGKLFQMRIYNRSITDAEVLQNFEVTKGRFGL